MKHFNLYLRSGTPEMSDEFKSEGEAIVDARSFLYSNDPNSDSTSSARLDIEKKCPQGKGSSLEVDYQNYLNGEN